MSGGQQPSESGMIQRGRAALPAGIFRFSAVKLLITLSLLFFSEPFVQTLPHGNLIEAMLLTLVMVFAVLAVGGRRRTLFMALVLVAPALVGKWINHLFPELMPPAVFLTCTVFFFGFIVAQLLRFIVQATRVDANVLCAGVAGFLLVGLLWVPIYMLVDQTSLAAFAVETTNGVSTSLNGFDAFYLSFITICTVGFGDVRPVSQVARMLAVLEAITGMFYMALLIARLVAIYSSTQLNALRNGENAEKGP